MKITLIFLGVLIAVFAIAQSMRVERHRTQFMEYCHGAYEKGMEEKTVLIFWQHHDNICSGEYDRYRQGQEPEMVKKWRKK